MNGGAELDFGFDGDALLGVAVVVHQLAEVELANDLFGFGLAGLAGDAAGEVGLAIFIEEVEGVDLLGGENAEGVGGAVEEVGDG